MNRRILLVLLLFIFHFAALIAQNTPGATPLAEIISSLKEIKNIEVSHDPELIAGFFVKDIDLEADIEVVFTTLMSQLPFQLALVDENYAVLTTQPVTLRISVLDQKTEERIPGVYIKKNGQYAQKVSDANGIIEINLE
ncbi:MAG: hypothetical protein AAFO69_09565, partial [Bacteroidota bacterium]